MQMMTDRRDYVVLLYLHRHNSATPGSFLGKLKLFGLVMGRDRAVGLAEKSSPLIYV